MGMYKDNCRTELFFVTSSLVYSLVQQIQNLFSLYLIFCSSFFRNEIDKLCQLNPVKMAIDNN